MDKTELKTRYEGIGIDQLRAKLYQYETRDAKRVEYEKDITAQLAMASTEYNEAEKDSADKKTASGKKARLNAFLKVIQLRPLGERSQSTTRGKNAGDIHTEIAQTIRRIEELKARPESLLVVADMKFLWKDGPAKLAQLRPRYKKLTSRTWEPDATNHTHVGEESVASAAQELESVAIVE